MQDCRTWWWDSTTCDERFTGTKCQMSWETIWILSWYYRKTEQIPMDYGIGRQYGDSHGYYRMTIWRSQWILQGDYMEILMDHMPVHWTPCNAQCFVSKPCLRVFPAFIMAAGWWKSLLFYRLQAKSQFKRRSTANNVEIHIPVPPDADSPKFKVCIPHCVSSQIGLQGRGRM